MKDRIEFQNKKNKCRSEENVLVSPFAICMLAALQFHILRHSEEDKPTQLPFSFLPKFEQLT